MLVDLGSLEHWPSNTIPKFNDRLLELLPGVGEHSCSLGKRGGFRERLKDGTWLGHVAEHVALELQRESGAHISRGKTRSAGESGQYNVIYGYAEEHVGLEAGRLAVRLVNHLVKTEPGFDFPAELERLILLAERRQFGPSTQAHPGRGGQPRHPVHPAERAVAGAARAGEVPAADPRHDDVAGRAPSPSTSPATRR